MNLYVNQFLSLHVGYLCGHVDVVLLFDMILLLHLNAAL